MRLLALLLTLACLPAAAQQLDPSTRTAVEAAVNSSMKARGIPGAQIAIVQHGEVAYTGAFGLARISPATPVTLGMPFRIGSNSKQFTSVAAMLLVERGKLRLDDPVSTWFPEFAHSHEITLRMLLNQVSGYPDDFTEDYLTPLMAAPVDPYKLLREQAAKPLNFTPGTRYQYSNTNYGLAALIVEKVAGEPFSHFLQREVLRPAGINDAIDLDDSSSVPALPEGYSQYAFGPLRSVPLEGSGTLEGDGELAMPVSSLALWNTVVLQRKLLRPESWAVLESGYLLPDGRESTYAMGLGNSVKNNRRVLAHSGEVNGFISFNVVYPNQGAAISVLTNSQVEPRSILEAIDAILFPSTTATAAAAHNATANPAAERTLRQALTLLAKGEADRDHFTPALNFYFTREAIADFQQTLAAFGSLQTLQSTSITERGGMTGIEWKAQGTTGEPFTISTYYMPDGKLDQLLLAH